MPTAYVNGYNPFTFADFSGGLNLRDKADAVGDKEAIDLLNVTFTERGAIRQRDGYADFTVNPLTQRVDSLSAFYTAGGLRHLIAGCGNRLEALQNDGSLIASKTGLLGSGPYSFARFGSPGSEYVYAANGTDLPQRWNGFGWAEPTATVNGTAGQAMPRAGALAVTAAEVGTTSASNANNRLIATAFGTATSAGPGGQTTSPSHVFFSNAGQPEIWETDGAAGPPVRGRNFIVLTPGDGEQIMTAVTWRELVFIFKETKFFVLWGESTASDGTPNFQRREVVNQIGLSSKNAVAVGRDGVYFFNRRGIYRTTGGDPQLLSDKISPLWTGDPDVYYQGNPINLARLDMVRMAWHEEQLFVAIPTGTSSYCDRLLVYDTQHDWWTIYDIAASALAVFRRSDRDELHHGYATGPLHIGHRNYGGTDDRGSKINSRWRSGWSDYQQPVQKTFREAKIWGSGAATISFSVDFNRGVMANLPLIYGGETTWPVGPAGNTYAGTKGKYATYQLLKDSGIDYATLRTAT